MTCESWPLPLFAAAVSGGLVASFPETTFVLEAAGWPLDLTADGFNRWDERLREVSAFPNVVLKTQGIALLFGTTDEAFGNWIRKAVSIFGAHRCIFASHYPIDHLLWDGQTMVATIQAALADRPADQQADYFSGTAQRVYRHPVVEGAHFSTSTRMSTE